MSPPIETIVVRRGEALLGLDYLRKWAAADLELPARADVLAKLDAIGTELKETFAK